jgi:hypothetical protein
MVGKFLQRLSTETRDSFNQMVDEIIELDQAKISRFRQKCMLNLIVAYHPGTVDGALNLTAHPPAIVAVFVGTLKPIPHI